MEPAFLLCSCVRSLIDWPSDRHSRMNQSSATAQLHKIAWFATFLELSMENLICFDDDVLRSISWNLITINNCLRENRECWFQDFNSKKIELFYGAF